MVFYSLAFKEIDLLRTIVICLLTASLFVSGLHAQDGNTYTKKEVKQLEKDGEFFFEKGDYAGALEYFLPLQEYNPEEPYYNLVVGICYTYDPDNKDKSLEYLDIAKQLNPNFELIDLYIARALYKNLQV